MNTCIVEATTTNSTTALDTWPGSLNSSLTPSEYPCWLVRHHAQQTPNPMHAGHGPESAASINVSPGSCASMPKLTAKVSSSGTARSTAVNDSNRSPTAVMNRGSPSNNVYDTPTRGPPSSQIFARVSSIQF